MPFYRVWEYPNSCIPYKHCYVKRERYIKPDEQKRVDDRAAENTAAILEHLEKLEETKKLPHHLSRAKRMITDLILCNKFDYFCTFTFDAEKIDRYNYSLCQKKLRKFFDNFKQRYAPDFKYLIIPEFHKDGAVHFHGVCSGFPDGELSIPEYIYKRVDGQYIPLKNYRNYLDWARYHKSFGFFNCSKIRNYNACAFYVTKYVTKDLADVGKGKAVYMASQGLQRPALVYDEDNIPVIFTPEFENEYCIVGYDRGEVSELVTQNDISWMAADLVEWEELHAIANDDEPLEQISIEGYFKKWATNL